MSWAQSGQFEDSDQVASPHRRGGWVAPWERWMAQRLLRSLGSPPIRFEFWNGQSVYESDQAPVAVLRLRDRGIFYALMLDPELAFGDGFSDGRIQVVGDLVAFVQTVSRGTPFRDPKPRWRSLDGLGLGNTRRRSRRNVHHHYDISNDFYRLWLDEEMVYTCAYFESPDQTLEAAQVAKMDHVCRKLRLRPGQSVVEAGCGWGAMARHMVRHYGVTVRAFNVSHEQIDYARRRAADEGLADRVEYVEDDYRNITGSYDAFVSVGMLEHVGPRHYRALGDVIDRCLKPDGLGLLHSIGRHKPMRVNRWIAARIFPGGHPPSLREMMDIFEPRDLSIVDVENLRLHYAQTLGHWLDRFDAAAGRVESMFDRRFVRMWRLYLAGSRATFLTGWMQLYQVLFTRYGNGQVARSRAYLYQPGDVRDAGEVHDAI